MGRVEGTDQTSAEHGWPFWERTRHDMTATEALSRHTETELGTAILEHCRTGGVMVGDVIRVGAQAIKITECDPGGKIAWEIL